MGNCDKGCFKESGDLLTKQRKKSGDSLQDDLNEVMNQLKNTSKENKTAEIDVNAPTDESNKDKKDNKEIVKIQAGKNGKTLVQFENGGVYEGKALFKR